jgi:hypothetical protein
MRRRDGNMKKTSKIIVFSLLSLIAVAGLGACGVKPSTVDAPAGVSPDRFPQTYPPARTPDNPRDVPERYLPDTYRPAR